MKYTCPCCGYKTLDEPPGNYDICPVCFWEDDEVQYDNPFLGGGANAVSLYVAQQNFSKYKACEKRFISNVRKPNHNEPTDSEWKLIDFNDDRVERVVIDVTGVYSITDFHLLMKESLGFPEIYGMNWDAFWDCIIGLVEMPKNIEFIGWYDFEKRFFKESRVIKGIFDDFKSEYPLVSTKVTYYRYD